MKIDFKRNHTNGFTFWKQCKTVEEKIDIDILDIFDIQYFFTYSEAERT